MKRTACVMKRFACVLILLLLVLVSGCGLSLNQLEAEKAYYQMIQATRAVAQPPLVDIKIADPTKPANIERITVYSPQSDKAPAQYVQTNYDEVWARALLGMTGIVAPMYGAIEITRAVTGMATLGNTTYNQSVTGTGNSATVRTAGNTVVGGNVGDGNMVAGMIDQTGTPTVVNQPAPIVVNQPAPVIVEQPAPIVVNQPAPVVVTTP